MVISLLRNWRSLLFAISFLALSCLIVDHLLCPEATTTEMLNEWQLSQIHCAANLGLRANLELKPVAIGKACLPRRFIISTRGTDCATCSYFWKLKTDRAENYPLRTRLLYMLSTPQHSKILHSYNCVAYQFYNYFQRRVRQLIRRKFLWSSA
jgi:hypothetical protein